MFAYSQVLGPRLMENRKPFHLQSLLVIYNAIQVVFSAWLFYEVSKTHTWRHLHTDAHKDADTYTHTHTVTQSPSYTKTHQHQRNAGVVILLVIIVTVVVLAACNWHLEINWAATSKQLLLLSQQQQQQCAATTKTTTAATEIATTTQRWQPALTTCNRAAFNVHFILCFSYVLSLSLLISVFIYLFPFLSFTFTFGINLISFLVFNGRLVGFVQLPLSARRLQR